MMTLSNIAKKIPVISIIFKELRRIHYRYQLRSKNKEQVFTAIYNANKWGGKDSVSGPGSDANQTMAVIEKLPVLLNDFNVSTMLDIPCGDFHWMRTINLSNINYIGADVVKEIVTNNREKYSGEGVDFMHLNLINDRLPKVDLIFCRDCLVHFSFADIFLALENVCNSQSNYLLTTTFVDRKDNYDISTGGWHAVNFELSPFNFPKPILTIMEGCTEGGSIFKDKSLGLWEIADIQECLMSLSE